MLESWGLAVIHAGVLLTMRFTPRIVSNYHKQRVAIILVLFFIYQRTINISHLTQTRNTTTNPVPFTHHVGLHHRLEQCHPRDIQPDTLERYLVVYFLHLPARPRRRSAILGQILSIPGW